MARQTIIVTKFFKHVWSVIEWPPNFPSFEDAGEGRDIHRNGVRALKRAIGHHDPRSETAIIEAGADILSKVFNNVIKMW